MNAAKFDRQEWLNKLRTRVNRQGAMELRLSPKGATIQEVVSFLKDVSVQHKGDNTYIIAKAKKVVPS